MSEEQGKQTEQKVGDQEQKEQEKPKKIELDEETYAALLDKLDELEAKASKGKKEPSGEVDEVDELAEEGRRSRGQQEEVDLDQMTPRQLINYIRQDVSRNLGSPLLVAVNELKYTIEMDKLMRPEEMGGNGYVDLLDFKDDIMALMLENPKMTMKRAYTLAKAENPQKSSLNKKKTDAREEGERETRLRHLPPHPRRGSFGERPGSTESSVTDGEPKDLREAAGRAFDKVMKDHKE